MELLNKIGEDLVNGSSASIRESVKAALNSGIQYKEIMAYMLKRMEEVGEKFKLNELFVPEVLIISRAFNAALEEIAPLIEGERDSKGTIVIGTVYGDLHNVGKNLVKSLMESTGVKVIDLGVDVQPEEFVKAIETYKPDMVAMSSLLTTTMIRMKHTIKAIEEAGLRDEILIMIGGAPVTSNYAKNIGADYYASGAGEAAEIVRQLSENGFKG